MEAPDKRSRKRSRKLSEAKVAPELPEKKRKRWSTRGGAIKKELGHEGQEKGHTSKPRKLLVSYDRAHLNLKLKSGLVLEVKGGARGSVSRENTPSSVASGGTGSMDGGAFPRRNIDVHFKNPKFTFSYLASNKKRTWKNTKQILAAERALPWKPDDPTYSSIDAPPPLKPAKKYADMSGFTAKYTDPLTGMYFSTSEEFQLIRTLPTNLVQGYLALRGKLSI